MPSKKKKKSGPRSQPLPPELRPRGQGQIMRSIYVILAFVIVFSLVLSLVLVASRGGATPVQVTPTAVR